MALTALELIRGALRDIGSVGESETLSAEDAANCLSALNEMMEYWNNVPYMNFQTRQDTLTWPPSTASRTIGPGGNFFGVTRPTRLERTCSIIFSPDLNGVETELFILDSRASYDRIRLKQQPPTYVWAIYYDPGVPFGTLFLLGVPTTVVIIRISSPSLLQTFPTLNTLVALPEGYQECIRSNLAIKVAPEFIGSNTVPEPVIKFAAESMAAIQAQNKTRISGTVTANPVASASP